MEKRNTRYAQRLINQGWALTTMRDPWMGFDVWLRKPGPNVPGCAKYISSGVYRNLLKMGIKETKFERPKEGK